MAYAFAAPEQTEGDDPVVNHHINPITGYALASEDGAAQYGPDFLKFWQQTTYLGDGKTPFLVWKKDPLAIDLAQSIQSMKRADHT